MFFFTFKGGVEALVISEKALQFQKFGKWKPQRQTFLRILSLELQKYCPTYVMQLDNISVL